MKEDYCSYNLSKLAKEKGFNWPVRMVWAKTESDTRLLIKAGERRWNDKAFENEDVISAPTHCHLAKWLREKHHFMVSVIDIFQKKYVYYAHFLDDEQEYGMTKEYESYYDAFEAGLMEALKTIKTKQL